MRKSKSKQKRVKLPRPYISWTQLNLWESDQDEYIRRYVFGEKGIVSDAMEFGKEFADVMENNLDSDDPLINFCKVFLPRYKYSEKEISAKIGKIKLYGKIDTYEDGRFREYKTGRTKWTQIKVDSFGQITFYALMIWLNTGKVPKEMWLDHISTDGGYNIYSFRTERNILQLIEMKKRIEQAQEGIINRIKEINLKQ